MRHKKVSEVDTGHWTPSLNYQQIPRIFFLFNWPCSSSTNECKLPGILRVRKSPRSPSLSQLNRIKLHQEWTGMDSIKMSSFNHISRFKNISEIFWMGYGPHFHSFEIWEVFIVCSVPKYFKNRLEFFLWNITYCILYIAYFKKK